MPDNPTTLQRAMEHCRKAHDNNCVMDVGDHDGIPCNAENCIAYREVVEAGCKRCQILKFAANLRE